METQFKFPEHIQMGDTVQYSTDGKNQARCLAMVKAVKSKSAKSIDLILFPSMEIRRDCWHADDPRVVTNAHVFTQQDDRGVFRLVGDQAYRGSMATRLGALERLCREITMENGQIKARLLKLETPAPAARSQRTSSVATKKTARKLVPAGA